MTKKRKPLDAAALEELEKTVIQSFTVAANSISQLYASAEAQLKATFHAGVQQGLEKVRQWIIARQEGGLSVTEADIITFLQNELGCTTGDALIPPASHSDLVLSVDAQILTSGTSVQNLQMLQGAKQTRMFGFASAPTSPSRGSPSLHISQGGLGGDSSPQVLQIGNTQMPAGNRLPCAFAQLDHPNQEEDLLPKKNQEEDLSEPLDSAMDMNIEEHPNQYFP